MLTKEQKIDMFAMRLNGETLQEIGDKYGITRERVRQILKHPTRHSKCVDKCVYVGLRKWCLENGSSVSQLAEQVGVSDRTLLNVFAGSNTSKRIIDAILSVTNLTYEEAFSKTEFDHGQTNVEDDE